MKKQFFISFLMLCIIPAFVAATDTTVKPIEELPRQTSSSKRVTLDKITVRVNGTNILQSELEAPRISKEGHQFTEEEAINEELIYQHAEETSMEPKAQDIERHLISFKIQNNFTNMSDQEFEDQLKQHGFTLKSYKHQLGRMIAVENVKRAEISEKIVVTAQEVEKYYNKHPEYTNEEYHLTTCSIPADMLDKADQISKDEKTVWDDLGWVCKEDIGKKFKIVFSMKNGEISKPIKSDDKNYQAVKMIDKRERRLKTLNEQYSEIEFTLQQQRKDKFVEEFEKELKNKASIIHL